MSFNRRMFVKGSVAAAVGGPFELQGVGGGVVELTSHREVRMWVGDRTTVGRAVGERFNEDSRQRREPLQWRTSHRRRP